jgi:hypothetical protein
MRYITGSGRSIASGCASCRPGFVAAYEAAMGETA